MHTKIYQNWTAKTLECGISNEQACGLAMLYAWTLTSQNEQAEQQQDKKFWSFVEKTNFDESHNNSFEFEDFAKFIPALQLAGELLRVEMPSPRINADSDPTSLLDLDWKNKQDTSEEISEKLLFRHRFDLIWCQYAGECLREEIRTPQHAYVFAEFLTHGFIKFDPEGYSRILNKILKNKSPIVSIFTSYYFVNDKEGLFGYLPFQIALLGFISNLDSELGEQLWNIQRALFYKQPSGEPINSEKQDLPLESFIEFSSDVITSLIDQDQSSYYLMGKLIASEYLYRSSDYEPFDQFCSLMKSRYGFELEAENTEKPLALLMNAAAFYTTCCLKIRNLTNRIAELPLLKMREDTGFLWSNEFDSGKTLKEEAIQCFDVMLSWRFGASWALFLETEHGFIQRAYIGDTSNYEAIDNLFAMICTAYRPVRAIVAFWTHRKISQEDENIIEEVVFVNLERHGFTGLDVFKGEADINSGRFIGEYSGFYEDKVFRDAYFPQTQKAFTDFNDPVAKQNAQNDLLETFPGSTAWNFIDRLKKIWETTDEVTYADIENISHNDNMSLMWLLIDHTKSQEIGNNIFYKSSKVLYEYNCIDNTRRATIFRLFESAMGIG